MGKLISPKAVLFCVTKAVCALFLFFTPNTLRSTCIKKRSSQPTSFEPVHSKDHSYECAKAIVDDTSFIYSMIHPLPSWLDAIKCFECRSEMLEETEQVTSLDSTLYIKYKRNCDSKYIEHVQCYTDKALQNLRGHVSITRKFFGAKSLIESISVIDLLTTHSSKHTFEYNSYGKIIAHELTGNLSGFIGNSIAELQEANSENYRTEIAYDTIGRIIRMDEANGRSILFEYSDMSSIKPKSSSIYINSICLSTADFTAHTYDHNSNSFNDTPRVDLLDTFPDSSTIQKNTTTRSDYSSSVQLPTKIDATNNSEKSSKKILRVNARGQVTCVEFENGLRSYISYYPDGHIMAAIGPSGKRIYYKRDDQLRICSVQSYSQDGKLEKELALEYSSHGPSRIVENNNIVISYQYDHSGKLQLQSCTDQANATSIQNEYSYNDQGKISSIKTQSNENHHSLVTLHHNSSSSVTEVETYDSKSDLTTRLEISDARSITSKNIDESSSLQHPNAAHTLYSKELLPFPTTLEEARENTKNALYAVWEKSSQTITFAQNQLDWFFDFRSHFEDVAFKLIDKSFWTLLGYNPDRTHEGKWGDKEKHPFIRITQINGILNAYSDITDHADLISSAHGGVPVHYVYAATQGFTADIMRCVIAKAGIVSHQATILANLWKKLIRETGGIKGKGIIIHYAHSLGGTDTYNALGLLTQEERAHIRIITFGSASLIPEENAINYVAFRDAIPCFDPVGYAGAIFGYRNNIEFTGTKSGIPLVDHTFAGETYRSILEELGRKFQEEFLEINSSR